MAAAIDALALPIQFFVLGSVAGMTAALIRHRHTGGTEHWPVYMTIGSLSFFWLGMAVALIEALV